MLSNVMFQRRAKLEGQSDVLTFGDHRFRRTHTWEAYCGEPHIVGRVISVVYSVHWYGAGAAHPNMHFETFCFLLDPLVHLKSLDDLFESPDNALPVLQHEIRGKLLSVESGEGSGEAYQLDKEWVERGTQEWSDLTAFAFVEDGIEFLFGPYQVAPYAFGAQIVKVEYGSLVKLMRKEWSAALGIQYMTYDRPTWTSPERDPQTNGASADEEKDAPE